MFKKQPFGIKNSLNSFVFMRRWAKLTTSIGIGGECEEVEKLIQGEFTEHLMSDDELLLFNKEKVRLKLVDQVKSQLLDQLRRSEYYSKHYQELGTEELFQKYSEQVYQCNQFMSILEKRRDDPSWWPKYRINKINLESQITYNPDVGEKELKVLIKTNGIGGPDIYLVAKLTLSDRLGIPYSNVITEWYDSWEGRHADESGNRDYLSQEEEKNTIANFPLDEEPIKKFYYKFASPIIAKFFHLKAHKPTRHASLTLKFYRFTNDTAGDEKIGELRLNLNTVEELYTVGGKLPILIHGKPSGFTCDLEIRPRIGRNIKQESGTLSSSMDFLELEDEDCNVEKLKLE